jgi:hypothetical protein
VNEDIRIDVDFWDHTKTIRLIKNLGLEGAVSLQRLWCYAAKHRPTGVLTGMNADDIEHAAGWKGEAGAFFSAIKNDWLDRAKPRGTFSLHDWNVHNSWVANSEERSELGRKGAHETNHVQKRRPSKNCKYCTSDRAEAESKQAVSARSTAGDTAAIPAVPASAPRSTPRTPTPSPYSYSRTDSAHRAREAAAAWNALSPFLNRPPVDEAAILAIADKAERVTDEILKLRADFSWPECINRINPTRGSSANRAPFRSSGSSAAIGTTRSGTP